MFKLLCYKPVYKPDCPAGERGLPESISNSLFDGDMLSSLVGDDVSSNIFLPFFFLPFATTLVA